MPSKSSPRWVGSVSICTFHPVKDISYLSFSAIFVFSCSLGANTQRWTLSLLPLFSDFGPFVRLNFSFNCSLRKLMWRSNLFIHIFYIVLGLLVWIGLKDPININSTPDLWSVRCGSETITHRFLISWTTTEALLPMYALFWSDATWKTKDCLMMSPTCDNFASSFSIGESRGI